MIKKISEFNGFTLIEVFVTVIIVAVLSLSAIQLYQAYVHDSKKNSIENVASSAAAFLNTAVNIGVAVPGSTISSTLSEQESWTINSPNRNQSIFSCPAGMSIVINESNKQVRVNYDNLQSNWYTYGL